MTRTTATSHTATFDRRRLSGVLRALGLILALGCLCKPARTAPFSSPLLALAAEHGTLAGTVVEKLPAGPYYYARLHLSDGRSRWVAGMGKGPAEGAAVSAKLLATSHGFYSPRLRRQFDCLSFVWIQ